MTKSPSIDELEVEVKNFGPIAEAKFDLRPLTLFIGPSNSGKSYLAVLIYALHRALNKDYERAHEVRRTYWKFPKEHFKELRDWLNKNFDTPREAPSVGSNPTLARENFELPKKISKLICTVLHSNSGSGAMAINYEIERCFGAESIQPLVRRAGSKQASASSKATVTLKRNARISKNSLKSLTYNVELSAKSSSSSVDISAEMPLYIWGPEHDSCVADLRGAVSMYNLIVRYGIQDIMRHINDNLSDHEDFKSLFNHESVKDLRNFESTTDDLLREIGTNLVNAVINNSLDLIKRPVHYFPADRSAVMHAHRIFVNAAMERATRGGIGGSHGMPILSGVLADFLEQLIGINGRSRSPGRREMSTGSNRRGLLKKIARDIELKILEGDVRSKGPNDSIISYPVFSYTPRGWSDPLPLMHASSMVSELSSIVLYLRHIVAPGDVLIIEEPEALLHPSLQVKFVNVLAEIVKADVRIILTTHSEWVLDAVANLVLSSEVDGPSDNGSGAVLSMQEVGLWSVVPKKRPKGSIVQKIKFDPDGGGFSTEFENTAVNIYNEWAELSNRRANKNLHRKADKLPNV